MANNNTYAADALKEHLLPGEEIYWYGKVKPFQLMEKDAKQAIIKKWAGCAIGMVLAVLYCTQTGKDMKVMLIMLVALAALMVAPIMERRGLLKYQYWITSKRAIIMAGDGSISAMDQEIIDACEIVKGQTSGDCLILCSAIFQEAKKQLRWQAYHPRTELTEGAEGMGAPSGMVFYALEDAEEAAKHLLCNKLS